MRLKLLTSMTTLALFVASAEESKATPVANINNPAVLADRVVGQSTAGTTLVVYSSPTCPQCVTFHDKNLPALREKFVDRGLLKVVHRPFVRNSLDAVIFMLAKAKGDDSFDETVSLFMSKMPEIAAAKNTEASVRAIAASAGIDKDAFDKAIGDQRYLDQLNAATAEATDRFGVTGTPAFFVNGNPVLPKDSLEEIDDAIAQSVRAK